MRIQSGAHANKYISAYLHILFLLTYTHIYQYINECCYMLYACVPLFDCTVIFINLVWTVKTSNAAACKNQATTTTCTAQRCPALTKIINLELANSQSEYETQHRHNNNNNKNNINNRSSRQWHNSNKNIENNKIKCCFRGKKRKTMPRLQQQHTTTNNKQVKLIVIVTQIRNNSHKDALAVSCPQIPTQTWHKHTHTYIRITTVDYGLWKWALKIYAAATSSDGEECML